MNQRFVSVFQVVINLTNVANNKWFQAADLERPLWALDYEQREFRGASKLERSFLAFDLQARRMQSSFSRPERLSLSPLLFDADHVRAVPIFNNEERACSIS